MKKFVSVLLALMLVFSLAACSSGTADEGSSNDDAAAADEGGDSDGYKIAIVPKMTSIAWFERMEVGINDYNEANGTDYYYGGSTEGDGQAEYVQGLLAEDYDAICVVPFDTEALDPILEQAREQGIVVITHEAAGLTNVDYDIEAFDNDAYGEHFMEQIGEAVGGKGKYLQMVGALTSASHVQWTDAAKAYQEENYPDMECVGVVESADDQDQAYNKVKEALTADPDIVAIQGSAMGDVAGAARAVEELGLTDQVTVIGTSLVSVSGDYVRNGSIKSIGFWDPALAGQAMIELAIATLDKTAEDGMSLTIDGYSDLKLVDNVFYANAWIDVDESKVDDEAYDF